ncbi:MAG: hypothetical protein OHK0012_16890 [Synechococcales cyanobacterium]
MLQPGFGRTFFDRHMEYIAAKDVEGMVRDTYTLDAKLYNAFPFLDTPPPNVISGHADLIRVFKAYLDYQGEIQILTLYNCLESEDVLSFQSTFVSPKTGVWAVGDTWVMQGGKIHRHFGFAHQIAGVSTQFI